MSPQAEGSTRVVIVRPTRDGDHIIINVTFGKISASILVIIILTGIQIYSRREF